MAKRSGRADEGPEGSVDVDGRSDVVVIILGQISESDAQ